MQSDDLAQYSSDPDFIPQQHRVLSLLAVGLSFTAAAEAAGVHRNTIRNWRREIPSFATAFEQAARDQARAFQEAALDAVPLATQAILAILNDPATPPALRLRAAGMILKMADIKSASAERETMVVMQPGVRVIHADPTPDRAPASRLDVEAVEALENVPGGETTPIPAQSCTIPIRRSPEPGRNSPCPCGSGRKFKRCCAQFRTTPAPETPAGTKMFAKTA
jgi:SEC-C motif